MKKLIAFLAIILGIGVMTPTSSEARDHHRHGHGHGHGRGHGSVHHSSGFRGHGGAYRQRVFVGYDRYRRPIYVWRTVYPSHYHGHRSFSGFRR